MPADSAMRDRNVIGLGAGEGGECRKSENWVRRGEKKGKAMAIAAGRDWGVWGGNTG